MVGDTTLLHIHQRLKEIFGCSSTKLFAGISIMAVGDLYQLLPIKKKAIFDDFNIEVQTLSSMECLQNDGTHRNHEAKK